MTNLDELIQTAAKLRAPGGCPWDAEQTHQSLTQYLLEETYELIEAIETNDIKAMKEELGDVLYQVIFHADIQKDQNFGIQDIAKLTNQKMKGRHPHVFGTEEEQTKFSAKTGDDVMLNWDAHKAKEKPERTSVLDGIPQHLPALALATKVLGKAIKIDLLDDAPGPIPIKDEQDLGKLLLAIVQSAKHLNLDAERALREATRELQVEIRKAEIDSTLDAGVIGNFE